MFQFAVAPGNTLRVIYFIYCQRPGAGCKQQLFIKQWIQVFWQRVAVYFMNSLYIDILKFFTVHFLRYLRHLGKTSGHPCTLRVPTPSDLQLAQPPLFGGIRPRTSFCKFFSRIMFIKICVYEKTTKGTAKN